MQSNIKGFNCIFRVTLVVLIIFTTSVTSEKRDYGASHISTVKKGSNETTLREGILLNHDVKLSTAQLITKYGYDVEEHKVTTADGYILKLFRIPRGIHSKKSNKSKKVVLVVHGFFGSSSDWIANSNENALAYILADSNCDVWLANLRGNAFSKEHEFLDTDSEDYWNFSMHEMGHHDIPSTIDYILRKTNESKLYYVAHSLGNNVLLITTSLHPEYSKKIKILFALAPGIYIDNMSSPLRFLAPLAITEKIAMGVLGRNELVATAAIHIMQLLGATAACTLGNDIEEFCMTALYMMANVDNTQVNMTWLPVILANYPNSASSKTLIHLLQIFNSKTFQKYDYGYYGNLERYGHIFPTTYNLSRFKAPVAIFSAHDDILAAPNDVARLKPKLTNVVNDTIISEGSFGHFGFLYSSKAQRLVYSKIIHLMTRF